MSRQFRARITENRALNQNHQLLTLVSSDNIIEPRPGQFYMLEVQDGYDPLLKRAFSLFRRTSEGLQVLYRVIGKGTSALKGMKEGTTIDLLGPLGNGYPIPAEDEIPLIVAGGIGMASVFSLVEKLSQRAFVFYGARTGEELFMRDELQRLARELFISTDDGSLGKKGTALDILSDFIHSESHSGSSCRVYACGPQPLLRALADFSSKHQLRAFLSLEEHMACGIGACLGCVVNTIEGYKRVCKEGPVFEASEIRWQ